MTNIGQKIYELRAKNSMSQGDLADALLVSRQSVSKWETNSSVPDLDKIVKLSELFGVSLDELVLDKEKIISNNDNRENLENDVVYENMQEQSETAQEHQKKTISSKQLFIGKLLVVIGVLAVVLLKLYYGYEMPLVWSLIFASPLIICGIICWKKSRHAGLWCGWTVFFFAESCFRFFMGIDSGTPLSFISVFSTYLNIKNDSTYINSVWDLYGTNGSMDFIISLILLIVFITLTVFTVFYSYKDKVYCLSDKKMKKLFVFWMLFIMIDVPYVYLENLALNMIIWNGLDTIKAVLFEILLVMSVGAMRKKKE